MPTVGVVGTAPGVLALTGRGVIAEEILVVGVGVLSDASALSAADQGEQSHACEPTDQNLSLLVEHQRHREDRRRASKACQRPRRAKRWSVRHRTSAPTRSGSSDAK